MTGPQLSSYVHVTDEDGVAHVLAPGIPVPGWAIPLITNRKAWVGGVLPPPTPAAADTPPAGFDLEASLRKLAQAEGLGFRIPQAGDEAPPQPKAPPRGGAGSGREQWEAYAVAQGVDVAGDMSRDDIIAALELANIPTE